jgi:outer membrane lipopolysaccharide assembly protein LptE/RlpB
VNSPMSRACRCLVAIGIAAAALVSTGCGYALAGRGSFLPSYIQTIAVPALENATPVFNVEQPFTDKLRAEFIGRGKYKVVPESGAGADAVLIGRINNVGLVPVSFTDQQQAARYELRIVAGFEFRDLREGRTLWENPSLVFVQEYEISTSSIVDPAAFLGQEANAVERIATDFAKSVVTAILEAF